MCPGRAGMPLKESIASTGGEKDGGTGGEKDVKVVDLEKRGTCVRLG